MTEVSADFAEEVAGYVQGFDKAMERGIATKGFSLEDGNYREAYNKIHDLYLKVSGARQYLEKQSSGLKPEEVSTRIGGIRDGAANTREAIIGEHSGSLLNVLRYLEKQLSDLLTDMHDSYVTYMRTDQESAFDLIRATRAADAS